MKKRVNYKIVVYLLSAFLFFWLMPSIVLATDVEEVGIDSEAETDTDDENVYSYDAEETESVQSVFQDEVENESSEDYDEYLTGECTGYGVPISNTEDVEYSDIPIDIYDAVTTVPTESEAYEKMIALKTNYPEGMFWTNYDYYEWKGGIFTGGYGCAGFAFMLSDEAFGNLPSRIVYDYTFDKVHVGDILRVNNDKHSVVVMEKYDDYVVLAEGNYGNTIHWGRIMTADQVVNATYLMTRYPVGTFSPAYTLSFDCNGGFSSLSNKLLEAGDKYIIPPSVPRKIKSVFLGWSTSKTASAPQYSIGDVISINKNTILYAVWERKEKVISSTKFPAEYEVTVENDIEYYSFKPITTGKYTFKSSGDIDLNVYSPRIILYDDEGKQLAIKDYSRIIGKPGYKLELSYQLEAGREYVVGICNFYEKNDMTIKMEVSTDAMISSYDPLYKGIIKDEVSGTLYYVNNGEVDWNCTSLIKDSDTGKWFYVKSGQVDLGYVGLAKNIANGNWYYVNKGEISWKYNGLAKNPANNRWYYVTKGEIDWKYNGLAKNPANNRWYYVTKGEIDWKYCGLAKNSANGNWYYVKNGEIDFKFTGIAKNAANGNYYYVNKGQLDWKYNNAKVYDSATKSYYKVVNGVATKL